MAGDRLKFFEADELQSATVDLQKLLKLVKLFHHAVIDDSDIREIQDQVVAIVCTDAFNLFAKCDPVREDCRFMSLDTNDIGLAAIDFDVRDEESPW